MKRRLFALVGLLLALSFSQVPTDLYADGCPNVSNTGVPSGFEVITVSTVSIGGTAATYGASNMAVCSVETNPIRLRDDGVAPTAAIGRPFLAASSFMTCGKLALSQLRMIRSGAADASVSCSYYKGE